MFMGIKPQAFFGPDGHGGISKRYTKAVALTK
jgi:hypothetical protein